MPKKRQLFAHFLPTSASGIPIDLHRILDLKKDEDDSYLFSIQLLKKTKKMMNRKACLQLVTLIFTTIMLGSCGGVKPYQTGINSQTQRVNSQLKRSDYTMMDQQFSGSVVNKKKYKKYTVDQLKEAAFMEAEKTAILGGADGVLNPVYMVDQKRKKFYVTARVKAYKLKSDNEYLDMENNLRHNPNNTN